MRFGESLKNEREQRGMALETISESTKVSIRYLQALENEAWNDLPGGVFNRGIVQSYCRVLALDERVWLERYAATRPEHKQDWTEFAVAVKRGRTPNPRVERRWWGVLLMLLGLAAVAWAAWHFVMKPRMGRPAPAPSGVQSADLPRT